MVKCNLSFDRRQFGDARLVGNLRRCVEDLKDSLRSGKVRNQLVVKAGQVLDRIPEHRQIHRKRREGTDRNGIHAEHGNTDKIQKKCSDAPGHFDHSGKTICQTDRMDKGVLMLKKKPVKLALRFLLRGKALDDADTGEVLVDIRRNIGRFFPEHLPSLVCDDLNKIHADSDQRQHENRT